jgi:hypothetical protein
VDDNARSFERCIGSAHGRDGLMKNAAADILPVLRPARGIKITMIDLTG